MAIYLTIRKISEDENCAIYEFGPDEEHLGEIKIEKVDGNTIVLKNVPGDIDNAHYAACAGHKLLKHWRVQEYPDKTCYAA